MKEAERFALEVEASGVMGEAARDRARAALAALPSSSDSHNSDGVCDPWKIDPETNPDLPFQLSGSARKTAHSLRLNVERLIAESGVDSIGFATFTVGDFVLKKRMGKWEKKWRGVKDSAEASRRWNNFARRLLPEIFTRAVTVTERHKSGAIHFHCIGALVGSPDIRTGVNQAEVARGEYSTVPAHLREIWALLRRRLPSYGFGRHELLPIKSTGGAVASYVSKYVEKNLFNRLPEDKGQRLVRYSGWSKSDPHVRSNSWSWGTPRACEWRIKARLIAQTVKIYDRDEMSKAFGPRWAGKVSDIMAVNWPTCAPFAFTGSMKEQTRDWLWRLDQGFLDERLSGEIQLAAEADRAARQDEWREVREWNASVDAQNRRAA